MHGGVIHYGLLVALAIALLFAAFTDLRRRQIDNWLNAAIALSAPLYWWASGLTLWPGVAIQFAVALAAFVVLAGLFALRAMGGGDVKLLTALALWIEPAWFLKLIVVMALLGGLLTLAMGAWHVTRRQKDKLAIPYGLAIAAAGLWVIGTHYLPAAGQSIGVNPFLTT
ncbi:MAG: A24 family peptidase [Tsuneonella sp.]